MTTSLKKSISDILISLYIYYANLLLGWQVVSFIYLYQTTNVSEILDRQYDWLLCQPYLIGIGAIVTILLLMIHRITPIAQLQYINGLAKQVMVQNIFLALLFLNYLTMVIKIHLEIFELIALLFAIWVLKRWGSVLYQSKEIAWRHPTTHGMFFVSALINGTALLSLFQLRGNHSFNINILLVILLVFDLFIIFARFRFLSKSGERTRQIARELMGRQIVYFGSRIIVGIFMPIVFIVYMIFIKKDQIEGVEILILVGKYLDMFLFIKSQDISAAKPLKYNLKEDDSKSQM